LGANKTKTKTGSERQFLLQQAITIDPTTTDQRKRERERERANYECEKQLVNCMNNCIALPMLMMIVMCVIKREREREREDEKEQSEVSESEVGRQSKVQKRGSRWKDTQLHGASYAARRGRVRA
jgi:hypothetical protein